ncbi:MAG: D-2-hydroxyacid dehydrogenase family protein [Nitrospinota bacterium]
MKVVILDDYQDVVRTCGLLGMLQGHDVTIHRDTVKGADALAGRLRDAEAVVLIRQRTELSEELIGRLPKLRMISQTAAAGSHIPMEACTRRKIVVTAGAANNPSTVELTWALILAAMRRIPAEMEAMRRGKWQAAPMGRIVHGKTLGVYALGKIGGRVAHLAKAFGMNVLAWGREATAERARKEGFQMAASREALFESCDIVTIHLPLNKSTRGIVTLKDLGRMKPDSLFVNTSRAGVVEDGALCAALKAGRPGFAAVDVYEDEPVLGGAHPLLHMENVVCTPHLGYATYETLKDYLSLAIGRVNAFAAGKPKDVVNPEALA